MSSTGTETRSVVIDREMSHPPEKVWKALTAPHLIEEWLMKNDFAPVAGHRFKLSADWGSVDCEVLTLEPPRTLSYTWTAFGQETVVTWTLSPAGAGTHLRLEQSGFTPEQRQAFMGAQAGWRRFLDKLDEVAARAA